MLIYIYIYIWFLSFFSLFNTFGRIRFRLDSTYNFSLQSRENAFTWAVWVQFMRLKWKRGEREGEGNFYFIQRKRFETRTRGNYHSSPPLPALFSKSSRKLVVIVSLKRNVQNIYSSNQFFFFFFFLLKVNKTNYLLINDEFFFSSGNGYLWTIRFE